MNLYALIILLIGSGACNPRVLFINDHLFGQAAQANSSHYYQVSMPANQTFQVLLINVRSTTTTSINIFLQGGQPHQPLYPTSSSHDQACHHHHLNTCPLHNSDSEVVYFGVECSEQYQLEVSGANVTEMAGDKQYEVQFDGGSAGVWMIPSSQQDHMSVMVYLNNELREFMVWGYVDRLEGMPMDSYGLGAFGRTIPLPSNYTLFYIIINSQASTVRLLLSSPPVLTLPAHYLTLSEATNPTIPAVFSQPLPQNITEGLGLHIDYLSGKADFVIHYCNKLLFTITQDGGYSFELFLSAQQRQSCSEGSINETLKIQITNCNLQIGYSADFQLVGSNSQAAIFTHYYGSLATNSSCISYPLPDVSTPLNLKYSGSNIIVVHLECKTAGNCTQMDISQNITHLPAHQTDSYLQLCQDDANGSSWYEFMLEQENQPITKLSLNAEQILVVEMGEMHYFRVPHHKSSNPLATFQVEVDTLNGDVSVYSSLSNPHPNFQTAQSQQVMYEEDQQISKSVMEAEKGIYIGVLGNRQTLYSIEVYIKENLPPQLSQVLKDGSNSITLVNNQTAILQYTSHIIPYNVSVSPSPACIQVYPASAAMPDSPSCLNSLPLEYTWTTLFIRIQSNTSETYTLTITPTTFTILQDQSFLMACENACYTTLTFHTHHQSANISYSGEGTLVVADSELHSQTYMIHCVNETQCSVELVANIPYGGVMFIHTMSSSPVMGKWEQQSLPLDEAVNFVYRVNRQWDTMVLYSPGATLSISHKLYAIDMKTHNVREYDFEGGDVSRTNPFESMKALDVESDGCFNEGIRCIVVGTIYGNNLNTPITEHAKVTLSTNVFAYSLMPDSPYPMRETFGMAIFNSPIKGEYSVTIQPLSSCQPTINYLHTTFTVLQSPNFMVLTNQNCAYSVTLSSCLYRSVQANTAYQFHNGQQIELTYIHNSNKSFTIRASNADIFVLVTQQCQEPSSENFLYMGNETVEILSPQPGKYRISLLKKKEITYFSIFVPDNRFTLLPNHLMGIEAPAFLIYNSEHSFQLCLEGQERVQVEVTVGKSQILSSDIQSLNYTCLNFQNFSTSIQQYTITVNGSGDALIRTNQMPYTTKVFPAFSIKSQTGTKRCFEPVQAMGVSKFVVEMMEDIEEDQVSWEAIGQGSISGQWMNKRTAYVTIANGGFCLEYWKSVEFFVLLQQNQLSIIPQNFPVYQSNKQEAQPQIFQHIIPQTTHLLFFMTNCYSPQPKSKSIVLISSDYQQITTSRITDTWDSWENSHTILRTARNVEVGYEYMSVRNNFGTIYKIQTYQMEEPILANKQWKLKKKKIRKIQIRTENEEEQLVIQLGALQTGDNSTNITYTLLIADSTIRFPQFEMDTIVKCPELDPKQYSTLYKLELQNPVFPLFTIPTKKLPSSRLLLFPIASAPLPYTNISIPYYYEYTEYELAQKIDEDGGGFSVVSLIILVGIILLVVFGVKWAYGLWKKRTVKNVQFQITEQSSKNTKEEKKKDGEGAYGQFVDEAQ